MKRRAIQLDQRADALDHALGLERAARESVAVAIPSYRGVIRSDTVRDTVLVSDPGAPVRRATFDIRQPPYTVHAEAALPAPPTPGTLALGIDLDTVRLDMRLGCGPPDSLGVRPAYATIAAPPWVAIHLGRVEQAPEVCAALGVEGSRWAALARIWARLSVSIGYVAGVGSHNVVFAGPGAIIGVKVWP